MSLPRYDASDAYTAEARDRQRRLQARVIEVFGDRDLTWLHRWDPAWGLDEFGAPNTPHRFAALGEGQLLVLLERLEELSKSVFPQWEERSRGRKNWRR
jgi:hypothetical protein